MLSYNGVLVNDVRRCSSFFNQLRHSHVKREGNKVAHNLTRYAVHILVFYFVDENVPPQCFSVIQTNLAGFS